MTHDGVRFRENDSWRQMFPENDLWWRTFPGKLLMTADVSGKMTCDGVRFRENCSWRQVSGKWLTTQMFPENGSRRRIFPKKITHDGGGSRKKLLMTAEVSGKKRLMTAEVSGKNTDDGKGFRQKNYSWRQRFPKNDSLWHVSGKWLTTACFRENNSWRRRFPENDSWRRRFPEKWLITAGVSENRLMAAEGSEKADSWRQRLPENPNHDGRCFRKETGSRRQFPKKNGSRRWFSEKHYEMFLEKLTRDGGFPEKLAHDGRGCRKLTHVGRSFRKNWLLIRRPWWPTIYNFPIASHIFEIRLATKCSLATASVLEANDLNWTKHATYAHRNTVARSHNHYCSGNVTIRWVLFSYTSLSTT